MNSNLYVNNNTHYQRKVVFYGLIFIIILFVIMSLRISVSYYSGTNIQIDHSNSNNIDSDNIESNDAINVYNTKIKKITPSLNSQLNEMENQYY
jgi:hypothetical protein